VHQVECCRAFDVQQPAHNPLTSNHTMTKSCLSLLLVLVLAF
jgi:hypothetical protein